MAPHRTRRVEQRETRVGDNKETGSVEEEPPEGMESKEYFRLLHTRSDYEICRSFQEITRKGSNGESAAMMEAKQPESSGEKQLLIRLEQN